MQIVPCSPIDIYRYFDATSNHIPKNPLRTFEETLFFSRKKVRYMENVDRKQDNSATAGNKSVDNYTERITKFNTRW